MRTQGSFGDVAVVGGASGMAVRPCSPRAAHAAGAGRVYVACSQHAPAVAAERPS